jgi:hypothetical protein
MVELVMALSKQGLGFVLAVLMGWVAYKQDRQVSRLNLRVLKLVLHLKELREKG